MQHLYAILLLCLLPVHFYVKRKAAFMSLQSSPCSCVGRCACSTSLSPTLAFSLETESKNKTDAGEYGAGVREEKGTKREGDEKLELW